MGLESTRTTAGLPQHLRSFTSVLWLKKCTPFGPLKEGSMAWHGVVFKPFDRKKTIENQ